MKIVVQAHKPEFLPATLHFLDKYWPMHPEVVIITWPPHKLDVEAFVVYLKRDRNFGSNMIEALDEHYHEEYFVNWLVDYILRHPVDQDVFSAAEQLIRRLDVCSVRLCELFTPQDGPLFDGAARFRVLPKGQHYRFSQQVALWQTSTYRSLLKRGEHAWHTETFGSGRAERVKQTFLGVAVPCVDYHNLYKRGHFDQGALQFVREDLPHFLEVA